MANRSFLLVRRLVALLPIGLWLSGPCFLLVRRCLVLSSYWSAVPLGPRFLLASSSLPRSYWSLFLGVTSFVAWPSKMADVEGGAAVAAQLPTGREAASACGLLSFPQPGLSPPWPVPEPGRVGQTQAEEAQEAPPLEMPPPPGQDLHPLRPTELAFSLPSSPQGCLGVSPPSFPVQDGSSAPSFSYPGSLPVSQILYTVAQRVARLQGKPKAPAVAPHRGLPPTVYFIY